MSSGSSRACLLAEPSDALDILEQVVFSAENRPIQHAFFDRRYATEMQCHFQLAYQRVHNMAYSPFTTECQSVYVRTTNLQTN